MIQRHIRKIIAVRFLLALVVAGMLAALLYLLPFQEVFHPEKMGDISEMEAFYRKNSDYVVCTVDELHYTGYNQMSNGKIEGSYYYALHNGICYFFLLSDGEEKQESVLEQYTITGRIREKDDELEKLEEQFAKDLEWSEKGLQQITSPVYVSEPAYHLNFYQILYRAILIAIGAAGIAATLMLLVLIEPRMHPSMLKIIPYGNLKRHLRGANAELSEGILADFGKIKMTEHYMVDLGRSHAYILPLKHIVWVFRISEIRGGSPRFLKIRYNLHLYARYGVRMVSSMMTSETASEIIRYLKQYSDEILTGYSEENRKLAKQYQKEIRKNKKISE